MNAVASYWEGSPAVLYFFEDITEIKEGPGGIAEG